MRCNVPLFLCTTRAGKCLVRPERRAERRHCDVCCDDGNYEYEMDVHGRVGVQTSGGADEWGKTDKFFSGTLLRTRKNGTKQSP